MSATIALSTSATPVVADTPSFRRAGLAWVALCALPAAGLLMAGRLTVAADCFWVALAVTMAGLIVQRQPQLLLSVLLGVLPLINLFRGYGIAFYNVTLVVLAAGLGYYFLLAPAAWRDLCRQYRSALWLCALAAIYYALSVLGTGDYARNLRLFELCLAVLCTLVAGRSRGVLGTGLLGLVISACAIGVSMLPHNMTVGRLGMVVIEGRGIGNPVQLGMALALSFLVLIVDRGQWLSWPQGRWWQWVLIAITAPLLALTTSRVAWLVSSGGMLMVFMVGRGQRLWILLALAVVAALFFAVLQSSFGPELQKGLDRTFGAERTLRNRTSGRSDQWAVAFKATTASWDRILWGYGPGQGPVVYARFSEKVEGVRFAVGQEMALHSLFMQVAVETGLVGLGLLLGWLAMVGVRVARWTLRHRKIFPLVCFSGYVVVVLTVSGNDTISAMMLGMGLLATGQRQS
jgi:O-antigen ligase